MAPHSSTLAWKIPWMEEPGRLQSMELLGVGHDWATSLSLFTFMHWRKQWQPTPVFLPGESHGRGAWWAAIYGVTQSRTWLKRLSSSSSDAEHEGDTGEAGLIPESERSSERGHGNPLQYSCHENPIDRGAWWARVHGVAKSQTPLKWVSMSIRRLLQADTETNHTYTYDWDLRPLKKKKRERKSVICAMASFLT